jgi:hypothetical protein
MELSLSFYKENVLLILFEGMVLGEYLKPGERSRRLNKI